MGGFISQGSSNLREQPVATTATTSGNSGSLAGYGPAVALRAQLRVTANIRISWAVAGATPSFTFAIDWVAITHTS